MKRILQLYIKFSYVLGVTLLIAPLGYLLYSTFGEFGAAQAFDQEKENEIIAADIEKKQVLEAFGAEFFHTSFN